MFGPGGCRSAGPRAAARLRWVLGEGAEAAVDEAQWLTWPDPQALLGFLRTTGADERKLRLFACACCRRVWHLAASRRSMEAVDTVERYLDRLPGGERLPAARTAGWAAYREAPKDRPGARRFAHAAYLMTRGGEGMTHSRVSQAAQLCAEAAVEAGNDLGTWGRERAAQAALLRDLFNPFRAVTLDPAWLTHNGGTAARVASAIHEAGDFDAVPVLADALEEAGCEDCTLLDHCRGPGPHVRGCWAVDLILGRGA
jgi:hypothetical protein